MREIKKIWFFIGFVILSSITYATYQYWEKGFIANATLDGKAELQKLYANYLGKDSFTLSGKIYLLDNADDPQAREETVFNFQKEGNRIFSQIGILNTYVTKDLVVQLDTLNRIILVSDNSPFKNSLLPFDMFMSDTATFKTSVDISGSGDDQILEIKSELNPSIQSCKIHYDPSTLEIKSTEIRWAKELSFGNEEKNANGWITKTKYDGKPAIRINIEEEIYKIIKINKGKVELYPAFLDYQLHVL